MIVLRMFLQLKGMPPVSADEMLPGIVAGPLAWLLAAK
jgi:hypothetical protein